MPHFIIDCSENILELSSPEDLMQKVHDIAESTALFSQGDIKVRIKPFEHYLVGAKKDDFIHIFANIMEGRTAGEKNALSQKLISALKRSFPDVPVISINIRDFEKAGYCNRSMV